MLCKELKVNTLQTWKWRKATLRLDKVVRGIVSRAGQARIRLMAKGWTTVLIIISPALHSISSLLSHGFQSQVDEQCP